MEFEDKARELFATIRGTARWWSNCLGHHEVICTEHLFFALCPIYTKSPLDQLTTIAKQHIPPWSPDMVVMSPGSLSPSALAVLDNAWKRDFEAERNVTTEDLWLAISETDPDRFKYLEHIVENSNRL